LRRREKRKHISKKKVGEVRVLAWGARNSSPEMIGLLVKRRHSKKKDPFGWCGE